MPRWAGRQQPLQLTPQPVRRLVTDPRDQPRQRRHPGQQDLPLPQPRHRVQEDRLGAVPGRPRASSHPPGQLGLGPGEVPQPVCPADLLLVVGLRLHPRGVPLHHRRVHQPQLSDHEVQHRARHLQRVLQERPEPPHSHQLARTRPSCDPRAAGPLASGPLRRGRTPARGLPGTARQRTGHTQPPSSSVRNSTGIDRKVRRDPLQPTHSAQTVTSQYVRDRPTSERARALTRRDSARYRPWPFHCEPSPDAHQVGQ